MRQGGARDPEGRIDVGLHRGVEILGRQILEVVAELLATGVVDQDIQPAQLRDGAFDHLLAEGLLAQIAGDGDGGAAIRADAGHDTVCIGLFVGQIGDGNIGTFAGKGDGRSRADAAVAAGDQRALALQAPAAAIAGLTVVGQGGHLAGKAGKALFLRGEIGLWQVGVVDGSAAEDRVRGLVRHDDLVHLICTRPTMAVQGGSCKGP